LAVINNAAVDTHVQVLVGAVFIPFCVDLGMRKLLGHLATLLLPEKLPNFSEAIAPFYTLSSRCDGSNFSIFLPLVAVTLTAALLLCWV
jgi:hypothetical protein